MNKKALGFVTFYIGIILILALVVGLVACTAQPATVTITPGHVTVTMTQPVETMTVTETEIMILPITTTLPPAIVVPPTVTIIPPDITVELPPPPVTIPTLPSPEHSTIYPKGNEASFVLTANASCSVILYLQENQFLKANYLSSPTDLGGQVVYVKYTYPEGNQVAVGGSERRSFETVGLHDEGYYSIDFYYIIPEDCYDPETHKDVYIYLHWEIEDQI